MKATEHGIASRIVACLALVGAGLMPGASFLLAQEATDDPAAIGVLRTVRDALVETGDFVAARTPAAEIVETLEGTAEGPAPADVLHLARIQGELQEFEAAEVNYLRGIAMLEEVNGEYSPTLITAYQSLGRSYVNARRFAEAVTALEQAQHISQRNLGLFNTDQSVILDDMTMAYLGAGDTLEARKLQQQRLDNAVRRFGADDPRVAPFHEHLGDYYDRSRLRASARDEYAKALELQEAEYGPDDPRLLADLGRLVQLDLVLGRESDARDRLVQMLERDLPIEPRDRSAALAVLGDWATVQEDSALAGQYYLAAYRALEAQSELDAEALFAKPQMIDFVPPLSSVDRGARSRPYYWGSIVLEFDLSANGRASAVRTVEATPAELMDSAYSRRIRETHFRPKLVDGVPAPLDGVRFTHFFRVYLTRREEKEREEE